jgi:hypothetical protein
VDRIACELFEASFPPRKFITALSLAHTHSLSVFISLYVCVFPFFILYLSLLYFFVFVIAELLFVCEFAEFHYMILLFLKKKFFYAFSRSMREWQRVIQSRGRFFPRF